MNRQHRLDGQFAESEATRKIYLKRFELLESALSILGFAEHVAIWKIAIMLHRVAGQTGGVLEWNVKEIAAEKTIQCSYKTARVAVSELIELGIVEVAGLVREKCRGGKPFKALKIDWPAVAKIINPPKKRRKQWVIEPENELNIEPVIKPNIEPVISNSLLSLQTTLPPPPTELLSGDQKAAVAILEKHLSDAQLVEQLATDHADEVETVVAEFELNRKLFRSSGAIRYRLQTGGWPTDSTVISVDQHRRATQAAENRRIQALADSQAQEAMKSRRESLEAKFGSRIDSMEKGELIAFGLKVLSEDLHKTFKILPGVYRFELLEALDFELRDE